MDYPILLSWLKDVKKYYRFVNGFGSRAAVPREYVVNVQSYTPQRGDLVLFDWIEDVDGDFNHVGIMTSPTTTIEGNTQENAQGAWKVWSHNFSTDDYQKTQVCAYFHFNTTLCKYDHNSVRRADGAYTYKTIKVADNSRQSKYRYVAVCKECGTEFQSSALNTADAGIYSVNKNNNASLCSDPYSDSGYLCPNKGTQYTIDGSIKNAYGNKWYHIDNGEWIYSGDVSYVGPIKKISTLAFNNINAPTSLNQGDYFSLRGTVTSNYNITSVKGEIISTSNSVACSYTQYPNAKSFTILNSQLDYNMTFNKLSPGTYYLKYTAADSSGKSTTWTSRNFTVNGKEVASTLSINNPNAPTSLNQGDYFSLKGTVTSNYNITSVKGEIISTSGAVACSYTQNPNTTSFTIQSSQLDYNMTFNKLSPGTYYLKYTAADSSGKSTTWTSRNFTVNGKEVVSTLSINNPNAPANLNQGDYFSLKGTVTSNYNITSVKGEIINSSGSVVCSYTQNPNTTSFTILSSQLDYNMTFNKLSPGTYYLKYTATDSSGKSTTWTSGTFTVSGSRSTLAINNPNAPSKINRGDYFSLRGTVTSNYNITSIRGEIISTSGVVACSYTQYPNATSFSILNSQLDYNMTFNKLSAGDYYLQYTATDSSGNSAVWSSSSFTVR